MLLNEQQAGVRDMARDFARNEIVPFAAQWDRDEAVPLQTLTPELAGRYRDFNQLYDRS